MKRKNWLTLEEIRGMVCSNPECGCSNPIMDMSCGNCGCENGDNFSAFVVRAVATVGVKCNKCGRMVMWLKLTNPDEEDEGLLNRALAAAKAKHEGGGL